MHSVVDWWRIGCSAPTPGECGESGGAAQFVFEEAEQRRGLGLHTGRRERLLLCGPGRWGFVGPACATSGSCSLAFTVFSSDALVASSSCRVDVFFFLLRRERDCAHAKSRWLNCFFVFLHPCKCNVVLHHLVWFSSEDRRLQSKLHTEKRPAVDYSPYETVQTTCKVSNYSDKL